MVTDLGTIASTVVAIAAVIGLLWKPIRAVRRFSRSASRAIHAIQGEPADGSTPAVMGLIARVDAIAETSISNAHAIAVIRHEVLPNGGGSLKDAVSRLEYAVGSQGIRLDSAQTDRAANNTDIKSDIAALSSRLDTHIDNSTKKNNH